MALVSHLFESINETTKTVSDHASWIVAITSLAGWLPALAALVSLVWGVLRIVEWFEKRKFRVQMQELELEAARKGNLVVNVNHNTSGDSNA